MVDRNVYDVAARARFYALAPYAHYKQEVYAYQAMALATLPAGSRVLDLGAGPGHLADVYRQRGGPSLHFVLLDQSRELLKIAQETLGDQAAEYCHRDLNQADWSAGLQPVAAVVSNNALFHLKPARIQAIWTEVAELLEPGGFVLCQQSGLFNDGVHPYQDNPISRFLKRMPYAFMPQHPGLMESEVAHLKQLVDLAKLRDQAASDAERAAGTVADTDYHFLAPEAQLAAMRAAGLVATEIWRKREFSLHLALKPSTDG